MWLLKGRDESWFWIRSGWWCAPSRQGQGAKPYPEAESARFLEEGKQDMEDQPQPELPTTNRRQFFSAGVRCLAIGGMAVFTASQVFKGKRLAGDPNCIRLHTCLDCVEFSGGCTKDKAEQFRAQHG